ncbi:MAG TPA: acyl carrier protein, partial [Chthoniobacterales bacterium]
RIGDYRERIEAAEPEQKEAIVGKAVRDAVASVLRVKPETLRNDQQLTDLGLDSLMGVEIENAIEISVGVKLPPASLTRARTIGQIVGLLLEYLSARQSPAIAPEKTARPVLERSEEVDLTAISDEEIARLLQEEAGAETLSGAETTTC